MPAPLAPLNNQLVDDGVPGGILQFFKDVEDAQNPPQLLPQFAHREFMVSADQMRALINVADEISYSFTEHPFTGVLGGTTYGLRVCRGYQEATIVWQPWFPVARFRCLAV